MNDLESRIQKLERSRRRYRWFSIVISLMLVVTVVFGAGLSIALTGGLVFYRSLELQTHHIKIVDADGNVVVEIGSAKDGDGGLIKTLNSSGETLVLISATTDGEGVVKTQNGEGQDLVILGVTTDGKGMVKTLNGEGQDLVSLRTMKDGRGAVVVYDPADSEKRKILTP